MNYIFISIHHIIFDFFSLPILLNDLSYFYLEGVYSKKSTIKPLKLKYEDFILSEKKYISSLKFADIEKYWIDKLNDVPNNLVRLYDHKKEKDIGYKSNFEVTYIQKDVYHKIKQVCKESNTTVFAFLFTIFNVVLSHLSGNKNILVGVPVTNRNNADMFNVIGCCIDMVVILTNLDGMFTFQQALEKSNQCFLESYVQYKIPFHYLLKKIRESNNNIDKLKITAVFNYLEKIENNTEPDPSIKINITPVENKTAKYDLTLEIIEINETFKIYLEYAYELFYKKTIIDFLDYYLKLIHSVINNTNINIWDSSITSANTEIVIFNVDFNI